jgi:hypothetical protein
MQIKYNFFKEEYRLMNFLLEQVVQHDDGGDDDEKMMLNYDY